MNERRVRFTATALRHIERERTWWQTNRDYQQLFATEFEAAMHILALLPGAGSPYTAGPTTGLRRVYVQKLGCHLYYTFNEHEVVVRALWGARRERGPGPNESA